MLSLFRYNADASGIVCCRHGIACHSGGMLPALAGQKKRPASGYAGRDSDNMCAGSVYSSFSSVMVRLCLRTCASR